MILIENCTGKNYALDVQFVTIADGKPALIASATVSALSPILDFEGVPVSTLTLSVLASDTTSFTSGGCLLRTSASDGWAKMFVTLDNGPGVYRLRAANATYELFTESLQIANATQTFFGAETIIDAATSVRNVNVTQVNGSASAAAALSTFDTRSIDATTHLINGNINAILGTALTETTPGNLAAAFKKFLDVTTGAGTGNVNSLPNALPGATGGLVFVGSNGITNFTQLNDAAGTLAGVAATATQTYNKVPTAIQNRQEMDANSTELVAIFNAANTAATYGASLTTTLATLAARFTGITLLKNWLMAMIRSDAADATALSEINAGGGTYAVAAGSQQAIGAEVTASAGSGPYTVIVPVTNGSIALQNVRVSMTLNGVPESATTDAIGNATFNLVAGTYVRAASYPPYSFTGDSKAVTGNQTLATIVMTSQAITPPTVPTDTTAYLVTLDAQDQPLPGVTLYYRMTACPTGAGYQFTAAVRSATSDGSGLWQAPMAKGATYAISASATGPFSTPVTIAATADSTTALPNFYA